MSTAFTRRVAGAVLLGVSLVAAACAGGPSGDAFAEGRAVFERTCVTCHGPRGRGTPRGPSLVAAETSEARIVDAIRSGVNMAGNDFGAMAAIPAVSDAEAEAVAAYVRALQEGDA